MTITDAVPLRVLLADDSAESRELLRAMLNSISAIDVVGVAANGRQAIDLLRTTRADVVFLDIAMPVMDGLEAAALIRARHPDLRIIVYSAYDRFSMGLTALSAGADEYFQKAANLGELVGQLQQAFPGRAIQIKTPAGVPDEPLPLRREPRGGSATSPDPRSRALLDALEQGVLVTDSAAVIIDANSAATRILGLPVDLVIGHTLTDVGLDDPGLFGDRMRSGIPLNRLEYPLRRPDGVTRRVLLTVRRTTAGEFVVSLIDLTDDRAGLRAQQVLDTTQEGVCCIDDNAVTTYVNTTAAVLLGNTVQEMVGTLIWDHVSAASRAAAEATVQALEAGQPDIRELELRRKDGASVPVLVSASPTLDAAGRYVGGLAMFTDRTRRPPADPDLAARVQQFGHTNNRVFEG